MARLWRAYAPEAPLAAGTVVALDAQEAHHVRRVLRLAPGERLAVFDGSGGEWEGTLVEVSARAVTVRLEVPLSSAVEAPLCWRLFQAASRAERNAWVIQKATELGVASITLWASARGQAQAPSRAERWGRIAVEAAKQCGRRIVPAVAAASTLPPAAPGVLGLLLDPGPGAAPLAPRGPAPPEVWLAVGPEGGFAEEELAQATAGGWSRVRVGPRVLRTETAGLVAAAILLHAWGDLGGRAVDSGPPGS